MLERFKTVSQILSLISRNLKRLLVAKHIPFGGGGVIYHASTSTHLYQSADDIRSADHRGAVQRTRTVAVEIMSIAVQTFEK